MMRATRKAARKYSRSRTYQRPTEWFEYCAWDDAWRSHIMDQLAEISEGNELSFAAGAQILLIGFQIGYDG